MPTSVRPEILDQLNEGIVQLTTSTAWQRWLDVQRRFHRYSFSNTLLISLQRPDATYVAGFHTWLRLGRHVRKGEKGIVILAPIVRRIKVEDENGEEKVIAGPGWGCQTRSARPRKFWTRSRRISIVACNLSGARASARGRRAAVQLPGGRTAHEPVAQVDPPLRQRRVADQHLDVTRYEGSMVTRWRPWNHFGYNFGYNAVREECRPDPFTLSLNSNRWLGREDSNL